MTLTREEWLASLSYDRLRRFDTPPLPFRSSLDHLFTVPERHLITMEPTTTNNGGAREGDLVELTKGETAIRGRVMRHEFAPVDGLYVDALGVKSYYISSLIERHGYTVEVVQRAELKLPTEPGLYAKASALIGAASTPVNVLRLSSTYGWTYNTFGPRKHNEALDDVKDLHQLGDGLVRLVAEVAK